MSQHRLHCGLLMTAVANNEVGGAPRSALPAPIAIDAAEDVYRFYLQQQEPWAVLPRLVRAERPYAPHIARNDDDVHEGSMMSKSIPIPATITKTPSEVQLHEDERVADYRDYVVFSRIVDHITRHQFASRNLRLRYENDDCLLHIIRTRQGDSDVDEKAEAEQDVSMHISKEPEADYNPGYFYVTDQDSSSCYSTTATSPCFFAQNHHIGQKSFISTPADDEDEEMFILDL